MTKSIMNQWYSEYIKAYSTQRPLKIYDKNKKKHQMLFSNILWCSYSQYTSVIVMSSVLNWWHSDIVVNKRYVTVNWEWFAMCFGGVQAARRDGCTAKKLLSSSPAWLITCSVSLSFVSVIVSRSVTVSARPRTNERKRKWPALGFCWVYELAKWCKLVAWQRVCQLTLADYSIGKGPVPSML